MSAVEVRELARAVIDMGGGLEDLRELVRRWEASRWDPVQAIIEMFDAVEITGELPVPGDEIVRALVFARAWNAVMRGEEPLPPDPYPLEQPRRGPGPSGRLRWRLGHGWRRDDEPDGERVTPVVAKPDEWFRRGTRGTRP